MMEIISHICIAAAVMILIAAAVFLALKIRIAIRTRKILQYGRQSEHVVYDLLKENFHEKHILRNIYLPVFPEEGARLCEVDLIIVGRGGIAVLEIKGHKGMIENPFRGDWRQFHNQRILQFQNPFEQNATHVRAVTNILRKEKIPNVPVESLIVFTSDDVRFKLKQKTLLTIDRLVPYLKDMNKNHFLSHAEISRVLRAIAKYRKKGHSASRSHRNQLPK